MGSLTATDASRSSPGRIHTSFSNMQDKIRQDKLFFCYFAWIYGSLYPCTIKLLRGFTGFNLSVCLSVRASYNGFNILEVRPSVSLYVLLNKKWSMDHLWNPALLQSYYPFGCPIVFEWNCLKILRDLHWLPVKQRIKYKMLLIHGFYHGF